MTQRTAGVPPADAQASRLRKPGAPVSCRPLRRHLAGRISREAGRLEGGVATGWKPALRVAVRYEVLTP